MINDVLRNDIFLERRKVNTLFKAIVISDYSDRHASIHFYTAEYTYHYKSANYVC